MPKADFIYEDPITGSQVTGSTPYGIYDADTDFIEDSFGEILAYQAYKEYFFHIFRTS